MFYKNGSELHAFNAEGFVFNRVKSDFWNARIFFFVEYVTKLFVNSMLNTCAGIQIHFLLHTKIKCANII